MADLKISALPVATTPLAGTEVIPIVQGGVTDQVSVANLTAGRNVAVGAVVGVPRTLSVGGSTALERYAATPHVALRGGDNSTIGYEYRQNITQAQGFYVSKAVIGGSQTAHWFLQPDGNFGLLDSNVIFSTAAKGVNFTANTPAAGMTSQLLNAYEEGTWTATLTATTSPPTTPVTATGFYTRVGRQVTVSVYIGNKNTTGAAGTMQVTGLPFTSAVDAIGTCAKSGLGATSDAAIVFGTTNVVYFTDTTTQTNSAIVAGAGKYLWFSVTYFV